METRKIRTALVGCGKVADFHALAYAGLAHSDFVACCDNNIERAKAFAERFGIRAYDNVEQMIRECGVEMVSVCVPHPLHAALAVQAADLKCNAVSYTHLGSPLTSSMS